jgi:hypothetical protein
MTMERFKITLFALFILISFPLAAQVYSSEKSLQDHLSQLKREQVDSIVIMRQGCTGCDRAYDSTSTSTATGELIYVLWKQAGTTKMAFIDRYLYKEKMTYSRFLFNYINKNKTVLSANKCCHERILIDSLLPYMFEEIEIILPDFHFNFQVIKGIYQSDGTRIKNKNLLLTVRDMISIFYAIIQSIPPDPES